MNLTVKHQTFAVSADFDNMNGTLAPTGFYFVPAVHSLPLTINMISNTLIKSFTGDHHYSIELSVEQLSINSDIDLRALICLIAITFVLLTYFLWTLNFFLMLPVTERQTQIKQLQRMIGVDALTYWGTMFVFDLLIFLASLAFIVLECRIIVKMTGVDWYQQQVGKQPLPMILYNFQKSSYNNFEC